MRLVGVRLLKGALVTADPRWLEILKASGPQQFAVALACALVLFGEHRGWFSPPSQLLWVFWVGLFLFGCLAVVSFLVVFLRLVFAALELLVLWMRKRRP
jgi:hypothetical protein